MTPYYLYSNGKLKKVEKEKPEKWHIFAPHYDSKRDITPEYEGKLLEWRDYVATLQPIEVHPDLQAIWKEGEKYYPGKDFKWGTAPDNRKVVYDDEDDYKLAQYEAKHELSPTPKSMAIPLPVESEESQEEDIYVMFQDLVTQTGIKDSILIEAYYKGNLSEELRDRIRKQYPKIEWCIVESESTYPLTQKQMEDIWDHAVLHCETKGNDSLLKQIISPDKAAYLKQHFNITIKE
jgi:hypothetical protein